MRTLLLVLFCISTQLIEAQFPTELSTQLQDILENRIEISGDHGVSACVILPDGNLWHGQAGVDKMGNPVSESTVFHGASSTKSHVATCMMLLAEDGLVDLDASWTDYVTLSANFNPNITVRHLISHTSGIKDFLETGAAATLILNDENYFWPPTELLEDVVNDTPNFAPGEDFEYSNSNYVLAGMIIEAVSGNGLFEEIRTRIWEPLGLEHTYGGGYDDFSEASAGIWWNFGGGVNPYNTIDYTSILSFAYGAGNLVTTAEDNAHFIRALLTGEIVEASSLAQMLDFTPESYSSWTAGYGMGVHHAIGTGDSEVLGHDGYYTNMSSTFHDPEANCTIVTMTNTQTEWYGIFAEISEAVKSYVSTDMIDLPTASELSFYPQPASDELFVELGRADIRTVSAFDIQGKQHHCDIVFSDPGLRIQLPESWSGLYTLVLTYGDGHTNRITFIVR
jgi:D-alanyl-D-alanine carboxypeptidase